MSLDVAPTVDVELHAPGLPITEDLEEAKAPERIIAPASPEIAAKPAPSVQDESHGLRRKLRWIMVALSASIAAHAGGLIGEHVLPSLAAQARSEELTYQRVWKSARSLATARRLGDVVPREIEVLQRDAERAAFAGDAELADEKLDQLNRDLRGRR